MTIKKTDALTANIRRETVPGLDEEAYEKLISGEEANVPDEAADYLIARGYATANPQPRTFKKRSAE